MTKTRAPAYSLNAAMLGIGDFALALPEPLKSFQWLTTKPYDAASGGVHDTSNTATSEYVNVTGFSSIGLLGFLPFN